MRDEQVKVQNDVNPERRKTFTNEYNKRTGPGHGSTFQTRLPNSEIKNIWPWHTNWHSPELCSLPIHGTDSIGHKAGTLIHNADL